MRWVSDRMVDRPPDSGQLSRNSKRAKDDVSTLFFGGLSSRTKSVKDAECPAVLSPQTRSACEMTSNESCASPGAVLRTGMRHYEWVWVHHSSSKALIWTSRHHLGFHERVPNFFAPKWLPIVPGRSSSASLRRTELGQADDTPPKM